MTFLVDITQFHLPDGRQTHEIVGLEDEYKDKYDLIQSLGLRFTIEVLGTSEASICLEDPEFGDFFIEIITINQSVLPVLEKMLTKFNKEDYSRWSRNVIEAEGATFND